jgi:cell division septum initiation protein DivIVA
MTKNQEIETLRETAEKLGPNSYCGDWLIEQLPFIEKDMRSDFLPQMGWADTRKMEQSTIALAKEQAARILKDAKETAERIKKDAQERADLIRHTLRRELEKALDTL